MQTIPNGVRTDREMSQLLRVQNFCVSMDGFGAGEGASRADPEGWTTTSLVTSRTTSVRRSWAGTSSGRSLARGRTSTGRGGGGKVLDQLRRLDLLVVDELGYLPMDGRRANLFFQLVAARYARGSLLITCNVPFDGWCKLFGEPKPEECPGARWVRY